MTKHIATGYCTFTLDGNCAHRGEGFLLAAETGDSPLRRVYLLKTLKDLDKGTVILISDDEINEKMIFGANHTFFVEK